MIIKVLFEKYNFPIETIVVREYHNLGLTGDEALVLIALFKASESSSEFSLDEVRDLADNKKLDIEKLLYSLLKKNFYKLDLSVDGDGKEREIVNLNPTFKQIEKFLKKEVKERKKTPTKEVIAEVLEDLEKMFNRNLSSHEIEVMQAWFIRENFKIEDVKKAISNISTRSNPNIYAIEREIMALNKIPKKGKIDPKKSEAIKKLHNAIKK